MEHIVWFPNFPKVSVHIWYTCSVVVLHSCFFHYHLVTSKNKNVFHCVGGVHAWFDGVDKTLEDDAKGHDQGPILVTAFEYHIVFSTLAWGPWQGLQLSLRWTPWTPTLLEESYRADDFHPLSITTITDAGLTVALLTCHSQYWVWTQEQLLCLIAAFVLLTLEADQGDGQIPTKHKVLRLPFIDYLVLVSLPDLVHPTSHK